MVETVGLTRNVQSSSSISRKLHSRVIRTGRPSDSASKVAMLRPSEREGSANAQEAANADHFNDPVSMPQTVIDAAPARARSSDSEDFRAPSFGPAMTRCALTKREETSFQALTSRSTPFFLWILPRNSMIFLPSKWGYRTRNSPGEASFGAITPFGIIATGAFNPNER